MSDTTQIGVIYARYSSDKQRDESIDGQIRECMAYAEREGITITNTYIDRALSAKTDDRPEFRQMILDSNKQAFNYVLVYQLDRFSRNRYDSAIYKAKLRKNGIRVISVKENIKDDPSGIILESVLEGMAEYYSAELSQKVMRGMTDNVLQGKWVGTVVPYGYKLSNNRQLEINEHEANVVRKLFDMYLQRHTLSEMASYMNANGHLTHKGKPFNTNSIKAIISNEKYIGVYSWGSERIENAIPPIIDKNIFEKAQHKRNLRAKKKGNRSELYQLCGKLECGRCGGNYVGSTGTSKTGALHHYYVCSNRRRKNACKAQNIRRDALDDIVISQTLAILNKPNVVNKIAKYAASSGKNLQSETVAQIDIIDAHIRDLKKSLDNYMTAIANGFISDVLKHRIEATEQELKDQIEIKANLENTIIPVELTEDHIRFFLLKMAKENPSTLRGRARIIEAFVHHVTIYEDHIEIVFNYKNELSEFHDKTLESSLLNDLVTQKGFEPLAF